MMHKCATVYFLAMGTSFMGAAEKPAPAKEETVAQEYQAKNFSHLLGMTGFDDALLNMHFQLYQGYVKNTNLLSKMLREHSLNTSEQKYDFGALKRRFGWEFDGMRLHELYFENLGGKSGLSSNSDLAQKMIEQYGSFEAWKKDFIATGEMRGIGWVILYQDANTGKLFNVWINEHDTGHLAIANPLLVMDVWEHAYITQYGLDRQKYIEAFFRNIRWEIVSQRFLEIKKFI